jgi:CubicO group peptidase (beta-lactamase class C family)
LCVQSSLIHQHTTPMSQRVFLLAFVLLFNVLYVFAQTPTLYFPPIVGTSWQTLTPASQNFCPERIDSLYHFLETKNTKSFILLKDGKIVLEKYFGAFVQDSLWYWASAGKSLTAFLVGQAQEEALVDIHHKTSDYLGLGWTSAPADKEALITLWHQLTMTNGLDDTIEPTPTEPDPNTCTDPGCLNYLVDAGTRWAYHSGPYRLLQDVIAQASGLTINQFTKSHVLDQTGMKGLWVEDVFYSKTRDMARYGLLALAHGVWDGDTLLHDQTYLNAMTHSSQNYNKSYGYLWWLNGQSSFMLPGLQLALPGKLIPNAPDDMYSALGKNDQKIHVVPSKGWVVVRMGNSAGYTNVGGSEVPIKFDNALWDYLNKLECNASATLETQPFDLKVSPNPSNAGWQIESSAPMDKVELFDMQGRLLRTLAGHGATTLWLEVADMPMGVFILKVYSEEKVRLMKLVKGD